MNLDQIIDHYVTRIYIKKYNPNSVLKILNKVKNSSKINSICGLSANQKRAPNYIDFGSAINEIFWFIFKSNMTQALAVLFAALYWDETINSKYHLIDSETFRNDILKIFQKYQVLGEIPEADIY